jgi:hypothetical protein
MRPRCRDLRVIADFARACPALDREHNHLQCCAAAARD